MTSMTLFSGVSANPGLDASRRRGPMRNPGAVVGTRRHSSALVGTRPSGRDSGRLLHSLGRMAQ